MADRDSDDTWYASPEWKRSATECSPLLVLELSIPEGSQGHLLSAVLGLWPSYLAYIVTFATIVVGWFTPLIAVIGYLVTAFILIFPIRLHSRQKAEPAVS